MNSKWQQSLIHRIILLQILAFLLFWRAGQLYAATVVEGATLLAEITSSSIEDIDGRIWKTKIKVWQYNCPHDYLPEVEGYNLDYYNRLYWLYKNKDIKTFILIHGNLDDPNTFSLKMAESIGYFGYENVQILLIDWEDNAKTDEKGYGTLEIDNGDDVPLVIEKVEKMFQDVDMQLSDITIIGHSYGAHIGGNLAIHGRIGKVTHMVALDPATEKNDLPLSIANAWKSLKDTKNTYVESYMSSSNFGNVSYTYGTDNFIVADNGLLTFNNFTAQVSTDGGGFFLETFADGIFVNTENHSRAHQFFLSTINGSSKVGWGWVYNGGKKEYHDLGFATEEKVNKSSTIPPWRGVILMPSTMECIDNNLEKTGIDKWYEGKIARNNYSELITAVCKTVDYRIVKSHVSVKDEQVFKVGEKATVSIQFVNNIVNRAFTERALTYAKLVQGASIKVWLSKTDEPDYANAKLVGCKTIYDNKPTSQVFSTELILDFSGINAQDYCDGAYLHFQIGAKSTSVQAKYSKMKEDNYWHEAILYYPTLSKEQTEYGYIEGEVNPEDNQVVIPIQFEGPIDLCFLFDTTGSMQDVLDNCKSNAIRNLNAILEQVPGSRVAVAQYRDGGDSFVYRSVCGFTTNKDSLISGINGLYADEGGDTPEAAYYAMIQCMSGSGIGAWRKNVQNKSIILFTDAPSNNYGGYTYQDVINFAKNPNIAILRSTRGIGDEEASPFTIYTVVPTSAASYYANITEATSGKVVTTYSSDEVSDAIISIIEEIIEQIDGGVAPWYPSYTFNCEHEHKAHEVWVYDGETLVTKMVVNTTEVTASDYLKAGCPGLESGKEYTFRVYEWEGDECIEAGTFTPEYSKPSSGTVTAEATENEEIYNLHVNIPSASKFMLAVYRGEEVCYPPTEFLFTDTDEEGNIITAKAVRMEFFEAGEYTVEVLGSNLAGEADAPATCTVAIEDEPVIAQYTSWPETGYTPAEGQTLLQAGNDVMVTFTWPNIIDAASYNLKIYDCYGNQIKAVNGIIDCHTTVRLSDDIYFWVMDAVLSNGKVLTSPGCNFVVAVKNDAPIISRIEAIDGEPTKVLLVCDKASSNYQNVSYDIQFYTAAGGWRDYMDGSAIAVSFSDEDGDGVYTGIIDFKSSVSGAYLLIRPRIKGKLITDKQTLFRLP